MVTREEIINSDKTLECPECGYILIGFNPVEYILCDPCYKKEKEKNDKIRKYNNEWSSGKYDFPDGWTCVECGDEYLKDTEGQLIGDYTEGTLCKKCNQQASEQKG